MSGSSGKQITCRGCNESIPADTDNCPHCGTSVRGTRGAILAIVIGAVLIVASLAHVVVNGEVNLLPYGFLGVIAAAIGGYIIYERRQRISEATAAEADPNA